MKTKLTGWAAQYVSRIAQRTDRPSSVEYVARCKAAEGFIHGRNYDVIHLIGGCGGRRSSYLSPLSADEVKSSIERGARWCERCGA